MRLNVLVVVIAIILSSCYTRTVYVRVAVPVPPAPEWVKVPGIELQCLSEDTFVKLVKREQQHLTYEDRLISRLKAIQ
jgi:hypothetical protein